MRNFFFSRFGPRARPFVVHVICQNEVVVFFFALRASCSFPRFEPRVRFFVVHIICQTEDIVFFALRASCSRLRCADVIDGVSVFFFALLRRAGAHRQNDEKNLQRFAPIAFAFFQIRADQK